MSQIKNQFTQQLNSLLLCTDLYYNYNLEVFDIRVLQYVLHFKSIISQTYLCRKTNDNGVYLIFFKTAIYALVEKIVNSRIIILFALSEKS